MDTLNEITAAWPQLSRDKQDQILKMVNTFLKAQPDQPLPRVALVLVANSRRS